MSFIKFDLRAALLLVFITAIAAIRVIINFDTQISPLANFSPVGAMALFGGAYFNKQWKAFGFPLLMLFLSDLVLLQTVFKDYGNGILYEGWYWVYGAHAWMPASILRLVSGFSPGFAPKGPNNSLIAGARYPVETSTKNFSLSLNK